MTTIETDFRLPDKRILLIEAQAEISIEYDNEQELFEFDPEITKCVVIDEDDNEVPYPISGLTPEQLSDIDALLIDEFNYPKCKR